MSSAVYSKHRAVKDARLPLRHVSVGLYPGPTALLLPPLLPILLEDQRPRACPGSCPGALGRPWGDPQWRVLLLKAPPTLNTATRYLLCTTSQTLHQGKFLYEQQTPPPPHFSYSKTDQGEKDKCPGASRHRWDAAGSVTTVTLQNHRPPLPTSASCLNPNHTRWGPAFMHC